jgi:carbon-monoxide dehydrogenase medium subunit
MIPPEFEYSAPESLDEVIRLLAEGDGEAKVISGGQSLLPLMKLRLASPGHLVDLRRVSGLAGVERGDGSFKIGARTRHADVAASRELGVAAIAANLVADQQVRNRGTIGGSLAHGDPAADMPAVLLACDGSVFARGPSGEREIRASDLFLDYLTTALEPDEVITHVRMPALDGYGFHYEKFNRRAEDWAVVGVCALVSASDGVCADVRIALTNVGSVPLRASATEEALRGQPLAADTIAGAAAYAADGTTPSGDLNATAEYKMHLTRVLTRNALERAARGPAASRSNGRVRARSHPPTPPPRHTPPPPRPDGAHPEAKPKQAPARPAQGGGIRLEQSFDVSAPLERVWSELVEVERIAPCMPGAQLTGHEDNVYYGNFTVKLGPATASYRGAVRLESVDETSRMITIQASGQDKRGQGSASAAIVVTLGEASSRTHVDVVTDLTITGRLARFGRAGMVQDVAEGLMRQFATCLEQRITGGPEQVAAAPATAQPVHGFSLFLSVLSKRFRRLIARLLARPQ